MDQRSPWRTLLRALAAIALLAYPLLVWRGLAAGSPRLIAAVLLVVLAPAAYLRLRSKRQPKARGLLAIPLVTLVSLGLASALNSIGFILLVPVAINAVFLVTFGLTLRGGSMPMVERFARLHEPDLSPPKQSWCRTWTVLWCAFFVLNGSTAGFLGWLAPLEWWALYTGLLAYLLSGLLLLTEWLLRRRRFGPGGARDAELGGELS